ncbi:DUF4124 domain-containing protein [Azonexus hydrophilus]|uniref:DUF4124 domain-containing protein n=1 Tax=Azonexus hydrophilus TaxID=418702 RepID=UPI000407FFB1|nr:DUF4124 domain-containing protein [Azonexus hydrophilus]
MKKSLIVALALVSSVSLMTAQAQTYQWKDANGKTVISDTPPPTSVRDTRALGVRQPNAVTGTTEPEKIGNGEAPAKAAPQTAAEQDVEFRKRQQEAREKAEKAEKEAAALKEKRDTCERARNNYRMLQSDTPVSQAAKDGSVSVMSPTQRRQELERTRRIMQDACK